jgi:pimeloyl-ACP methyl ester carboxylesterase
VTIDKQAATELIGGYWSCEASYMPMIEENAVRGTNVLTYEDPRRHGSYSKSYKDIWHPEKKSLEVANAVATSATKEFGIPAIDLEGHSLGGFTAYSLAKFGILQTSGPWYRSLTMLAGAGATGHHIPGLTFHMPLMLGAELGGALKQNPSRRQEVIMRSILYGISNVPRAAGEAICASECRVPPEGLQDLSEQGIVTAAIYYVRDKLFPGKQAEKRIAQAVDFFMLGRPEWAGHLAPHTAPRDVAIDYQTALTNTGLFGQL